MKRKKQFAVLIPSTKTHFEIGINLKGWFPPGVRNTETKSNGMCSHKINISHKEQITDEEMDW